ncbi:endonuclease [Streptomyces griseoincarnatus]
MPAVRIRRRKAVALASAAVLAGLAVPALTPATAGASAPAQEAPAAQARVAAVAAYADYYEGAEGKTGEALKSALHSIVSDQTKLSYSAVWNALKETDEDPSNSGNVILLYSGASRSKSLNGGDVGDWNREHVWAKSHGDFGTSTGPGTDIHHLRPSDVQVNSIRGNKDFDNGGSAVTNGGGSLTDSDSFEPRDAVKGDVARMILYVAVRYEGTDGWPDLEPNNSVSNGSAPYIGKLSVLKEWHEQDPPDSFEQRRNDVIFESYQHNRNPFIDHPEWVEAIW